MCSQCHKRVAVIFVTKMENGEKTTQGLCMKCAKELGVPIDNIVGNVINQLGISPEQLENAEKDLGAFLQGETPSDADDNEDGGAPAIDLPKLFREAGLAQPTPPPEGDVLALETTSVSLAAGSDGRNTLFPTSSKS